MTTVRRWSLDGQVHFFFRTRRLGLLVVVVVEEEEPSSLYLLSIFFFDAPTFFWRPKVPMDSSSSMVCLIDSSTSRVWSISPAPPHSEWNISSSSLEESVMFLGAQLSHPSTHTMKSIFVRTWQEDVVLFPRGCTHTRSSFQSFSSALCVIWMSFRLSDFQTLWNVYSMIDRLSTWMTNIGGT